MATIQTTALQGRKTDDQGKLSLRYFQRLGRPVVAPATPVGGPVCIVRVSGEDLSFIESFIGGALPAAGHFAYRELKIPGEQTCIDRSLVLRFQKPHSFTGEDVVEIQCHGIPSIVERITEAICSLGAEFALPGEFSFRAFYNGKWSLAEAEALQSALKRSHLDTHEAQSLLGYSRLGRETLDELIQLALRDMAAVRGRVEAAIDFPEAEEEQTDYIRSARDMVERTKLRFVRLVTAFENFSKEGSLPVVAIVGPSNVGKSTLFNMLSGAERSIVSHFPGTTRDYLETRVKLPSGAWIRLMDTAGFRDLETSADRHEEMELEGMRRARDLASSSWVNLHISKASERTDSGSPVRANDLCIYSHADAMDKSGPWDFDFIHDKDRVVRTLFAEIDGRLADEMKRRHESTDSENSLLTSERQELLLRSVASELEEVSAALDGHRPLEIVATHLSKSEELLRQTIGRGVSDAYLGEIFSQFCLGK